jgi:NPCBM/NEW2 domain
MSFIRLTLAAAALAVPAVVVPSAVDAAAPAAPDVAYQVTLEISAKNAVAREDTVRLSGTVSPKPPKDSKVVVQVMYEGKNVWRKAGSATVKKNGKYLFVEKPESHLDRVYRVVKPTDDTATKDTSRERSLHVIGWTWLTKLVPSATSGILKADNMPINGESYDHTLYGASYQVVTFSEFTLGRKCTSMEATFGLSDRTETGGQATVFVNADGVLVYGRAFALGESELRKVDVTGVYRLRMDFRQTANTPPTEPSAGAARVLCD